jgi:transposase-like protein
MTRKNQEKSPMERYTIKDLKADFPNDEACLEWLKNRRWPNGIHCEKCGRVTKHHLMSTRKSYSCQECGNHVHPTAGTIFHKSPTPLILWWHAIFLLSQTRGGIAAKQVERELGVTYKTAWRMCKLIRQMLDENIDPFTGKVEIDETYHGGKMRGGKRGRGSENKTPVLGIVERGGHIQTTVVENVQKATLQPIIEDTVSKEATVYTDEHIGYNGLTKAGYEHYKIVHSHKVYVIDDIHTQTIDGFWGNFKNGVRGVHHHVSDTYLQNYLNEHAFRYSHRNDVRPMFLSFLDRIGAEVAL